MKDGEKTGRDSDKAPLSGTTLRVYRYIYRKGTPQNLHDIQRGLNLSSASVAQYHVRKLLQQGLVREEHDGVVVDKVVFESMIRVRRSIFPFQMAYAVFFGTMLSFLIVFLRTGNFSEVFDFAVIACAIAFGIFLVQALASVRKSY